MYKTVLIAKRGASAAVNTATKNTNGNTLLQRKYCSIDDTNPYTNPKLPS